MKRLICKIFGHKDYFIDWFDGATPIYSIDNICFRCGQSIESKK